MEPNLSQFHLARQMADTVREPFLVLDETLRVLYASGPFYRRFEVSPDETLGRPLFELGNGQWDIPRLRELLGDLLRAEPDGGAAVEDFPVEHEFESIGRRAMRLNARKLAGSPGERGSGLILLAIEDVTDRQRAEGRLTRQALEATLLHKATALAAETSSFEEALEACVEIVCELTDWPAGHVLLPAADDPDRLVTTNIWHLRNRGDDFAAVREATEQVHFSRGDGLPGLIWESGEPAWVAQLRDEPRGPRDGLAGPPAEKGAAQRSAADKGAFGFPIKIRGETVAVLEFFSDRTVAPDRSLLAMVRSLGEQVGRVIERNRADVALRRSEEELSELFEQAAVGLFFLSPGGIVRRANRGALRMLGYAAHEFVGRPLREFVLDKTVAEELDECCREGGDLADCEARLRAKDGTSRFVLIDANARFDGRAGLPGVGPGKVDYLRCFTRDITDRRRDESERARLAAIVQSSDDAILGLSPDGLITSWNPGAERLYGYAADEAIGGSISLIVPSEREEETTRLLETVKRGERVEQYETIRIHRDGRRIHVALTASPIRSGAGIAGLDPDCEGDWENRSDADRAAGKPAGGDCGCGAVKAEAAATVAGVAVIERDISERKRVAAEVRRAVQDAERANKAKGEFLANVSHELRTPMNAIIGMTELSLDEPLPERVRDYLETAKDSADVLLRLLNDILDFSRIEAGRFELDVAKFGLRDALEETVKTFAPRAGEKGIEVALHMPPEVPNRLVGDPVRLRQVLNNLIGNAIKFTARGEIVVRVEPHAIRGPGIGSGEASAAAGGEAELHFSVRDTGIGISAADQERIFAPFAQVDATSTRNHGGAGLGLAICRELVAMMDGRLWVESRPGAGATFHFLARFGLQAEAAGPAPMQVRELKGLPVLVVDDNATNRRILEDTLKNWQMQPVLVSDAAAALARLRSAAKGEGAFPLVIVDGLMPGTDGFTLVEQIKADKELAGATVLMLSSADRRLFRERCDRLDIAAYLEKPVTQSELLDTIVTALHGPPLDRDAAERAGTIGAAEQPLNVLLVEDTPANRKVVTAVLGKRGHAVTIAADGREAVDLFKTSQSFDIVLMDVQMPNMDGYQATGIIRTIEHSRGAAAGRAIRVPIVAMTAHAMRGDRERCLASGMDAYLSKPIDVRRMIRLIERIARRHHRAAAEAAAVSAAAKQEVADMREDGPAENGFGSILSSPVFDRASALERLGGDTQLLQELADYFMEDSEDLLKSVDRGLAESDWPALRMAAHSLKGLAANFSADAATAAAREVERRVAEGDVTGLAPPIARLRTEVLRLRRALKSSPEGD